MSKKASLIVYLAAIGIFLGFAFLPESGGGHSGGDIFRVNLGIIRFVFWVALIMAGFLLLGGFNISRVSQAYLRYWPVALLLSLVGFPLAVMIHIVVNLAPWTVQGHVVAPTGEEYVFLDSSFLQGQTMALAKVDKENAVYSTYKVLGTTRGDYPQSYSLVVRPAGSSDQYGQLYLIDNFMLCGVRTGTQCHLAFDLQKDRFIGFSDIEEVSPFICLGATDEPHPGDVEAIIELIEEGETKWMSYPSRESLRLGLDHPNPKARELTREFLDLLDAVEERQAAEEAASSATGSKDP